MNEGRISVRYSRALFQSALEKNILGVVYKDMTEVLEICSIPEVKELLLNPVVVPSRKTTVLHNIFSRNLNPLSLSLIDLVIRNGRDNYLSAIAREFVNITKKYNGITESVLTTAVPVNAEVKKQVITLIETYFKTKVDLKENIDDSIIGGFVLKIEDNLIDASIKNKLRKIRKELTARSIN